MEKKGVTKRSTTPLATPPFPLHDESSEAKVFSTSFERVVELLQGRKNIIVLLGAGISVSCGIPDFRSSSGLYATLDMDKLNLSCPEDLFDREFFLQDPSPFYQFARNLYFPLGGDKRVEPSDSHKLLAILERNKMLLRVYSQNIDGLESLAGVSNKKIVYAHGNLLQAACIKCKRKVPSEEILPNIIQGTVPRCKAETKKVKRQNSNASTDSNTATRPTRSTSKGPYQRTRKRQRLSCDDECGGVLKPTVTFFGESLSDSVNRSLEADREKVDALIVIGTSLSVAPISKVIGFLPQNIPRILINRTVVHPPNTSSASSENDHEEKDEHQFRDNYVFDAYLLGFCDDITRALAKQMFKEKTQGTTANSKVKKSEDAHGGKLLAAALEGEDEDFKAEEWSDITVPSERVLLFPGALPLKKVASEEVIYQEIARCDGCSKRIRGDIRKCICCFDYDLCQKW
jgi:NAD-dependent SIR2 family protein deacetylase